jgi:hypothetical protein
MLNKSPATQQVVNAVGKAGICCSNQTLDYKHLGALIKRVRDKAAHVYISKLYLVPPQSLLYYLNTGITRRFNTDSQLRCASLASG